MVLTYLPSGCSCNEALSRNIIVTINHSVEHLTFVIALVITSYHPKRLSVMVNCSSLLHALLIWPYKDFSFTAVLYSLQWIYLTYLFREIVVLFLSTSFPGSLFLNATLIPTCYLFLWRHRLVLTSQFQKHPISASVKVFYKVRV